VVPFFGRLAACDRSAGVLARRVKAPLVFAACYRQEGPRPYRLVFSRVVLPEDLDGLDASQVMGLVNRETERLILACPEQYFWLHDRYKGLPRDL
jgi:lauroyl/myristoyl acyltransferase